MYNAVGHGIEARHRGLAQVQELAVYAHFAPVRLARR